MFNKLVKWLTNHRIQLLLILIVTAVLRFYGLDFQSPWLDEIHTLNESNPNYSLLEVYDRVIRAEQLPPLYFYIIHFLFKVFGYTIFVARAFSALIGVASAYALYLLARELINRKTALIATLLFAVNYYMIFYSQEARPYMMFVFFGTLSYYWMVRFLKKSSIKNAIWYGVAAGFLIHSHIVGFFLLLPQFATVLLYSVTREKTERRQLIINGLITAGVTVVLYLPAVGSLLNVFEIKSFWIKPPADDALTMIYKGFFGHSEILVFLNLIFFIGFLIWFYRGNHNRNKAPFSKDWILIILIFWIALYILIPLIRTYTSVPMIIGRYFIVLVPAIILMLAIGITRIKGNLVMVAALGVYVMYSMIHLVLKKDYYTGVKKSQFREATEYIMIRNKENDRVVTSLAPYVNYFFEHGGKDYEVVHSSLDDYLKKQKNEEQPKKSFWYFDAHNRKFNVSEQTKKYLNKYYITDESFKGFDAWARHFMVRDTNTVKIDFAREEYEKITQPNRAKMNIDFFKLDENHLKTTGWAILESVDSKNTTITTMLVKDSTAYAIASVKKKRPDVTKYFKTGYNADFSGFEIEAVLDFVPKGIYRFGVLLENDQEGLKRLLFSNKEVEVQ